MDNTVYFKKCADYSELSVSTAIDDILTHFGGVDNILRRGKDILIKPNLLMARSPDTATTAHPEIVYAVAKRFADAGANVVIADSPGGPYNKQSLKKVYQECGMDRAAQRSGAQLNYDISSKKITYDGIRTRQFELIAPAFNASTIISISKAKTHSLTYYTGAVKNLFGTIAGLNKAACHAKMPDARDFCEFLVDLCNYNEPYISITDAVEGMDGKGPSGGRVRKVGVIAASYNPYALDLAMMDLVGLDYRRSPVHSIACQYDLVAHEPHELIRLGDDIEPLKEKYIPAAKTHVVSGVIRFLPKPIRNVVEPIFIKYPKMTNRCIGCADCARACPQAAITVVAGKAQINKDKCIKCYCCHELCPIKAIDL